MESVNKARCRLKNYPILIGKCAASGSVYAACVVRDFNISHKVCAKEFEEFKNCLLNEAKKIKSPL